MTKELIDTYLKFRERKPFGLVGHDADCSLRAAKTLLAFRQAEADVLVWMRCEEERESYFSVFGEPEPWRNGHKIDQQKANDELREILDRDGVWWTCSEWFDGRKWHHADSCGMHTGYKDALDPFENCYVIDEMRAALDELEKHQSTILQTQLAECYP